MVALTKHILSENLNILKVATPFKADNNGNISSFRQISSNQYISFTIICMHPYIIKNLQPRDQQNYPCSENYYNKFTFLDNNVFSLIVFISLPKAFHVVGNSIFLKKITVVCHI